MHLCFKMSHEQIGVIKYKFVLCSGGCTLLADGSCLLAGHVGNTMTSAGLSLIPLARTSEKVPTCIRDAIAMATSWAQWPVVHAGLHSIIKLMIDMLASLRHEAHCGTLADMQKDRVSQH